MALTTQQVLDLAPDKNSLKAARKLTAPAKWVTNGGNQDALWGEVRSSGKKTYTVMVDLANGPAFKCSCPSRKTPCKHTLALMLLDAEGALPKANAPADVQEWLDARKKRLQRAKNPQPVDAKEAAKRAAKRQATILAGLDDLELWMGDLIRNGLSAVQGTVFYDKAAERLVNAQAPALANRVRALAHLPRDVQWAEYLLAELGDLYLISQGFRRLDDLPDGTRADVRTAVGWPLTAHELIDAEAVEDDWFVLGRALDNEGKLRVQRTWLCGQTSGRVALLLDFAHGNDPFDTHLMPGEALCAKLAFYPSGYPLRAVLRERKGASSLPDSPPGYANIMDSVHAFSAALAAQPWMTTFPVALREVVPVLADGLTLVDEHGHVLRVPETFTSVWELVSLSGGHPVWLFGELSGRRDDITLTPLTACKDRLLTFTR